MNRHFHASRPGEAAKNNPRWQFGITNDDRCGAIITHHIPDVAWRHAITKHYDIPITAQDAVTVINGAYDFKRMHSSECLENNEMWADTSEHCNSITRDAINNVLCLTFGLWIDQKIDLYFGIREDSEFLKDAEFYKFIIQELVKYDKTVV